MSLRRWLRSLERSSRSEMISIRLRDGSIAYFTQEDLKQAFLTWPSCTPEQLERNRPNRILSN